MQPLIDSESENSELITATLFFSTLGVELCSSYFLGFFCAFGATILFVITVDFPNGTLPAADHGLYFLAFGIMGWLHSTVLNMLPIDSRKSKIFYTSCIAGVSFWLPIACCVYSLPPYAIGIPILDNGIVSFQSNFCYPQTYLSLAIIFGLVVRCVTAFWLVHTDPIEQSGCNVLDAVDEITT